MHVAIRAAIACYMTGDLSIAAMLQHPQFADAELLIVGYLLILNPMSIVISIILKTHPIKAEGDAKKAQLSGIVAGGELIGYLERIINTDLYAGGQQSPSSDLVN